jgi:hypothetical protein
MWRLYVLERRGIWFGVSIEMGLTITLERAMFMNPGQSPFVLRRPEAIFRSLREHGGLEAMDPKIDRLITELRDSDSEVRRRALDELSGVDDKKHVVPAIHWTMLNDIDDEIREYARGIYLKIGEQQKASAAAAAEKASADETEAKKEERRVHIRPALGWPNPWGTWSVHFSLFSIGLIIVALLWGIPYAASKPGFLQVLEFIGLGLTVPGIFLGIMGLVLAGERKKTTPTAGIILNGVILLTGIWNLILKLRS